MKKLLICLIALIVPAIMLGQQSVTVSNPIAHLIDGNGKTIDSSMGGTFTVKEIAGSPKSISFNMASDKTSTSKAITFKANNINYKYTIETINGQKWIVLGLGSSSYTNSFVFMMPQNDSGIGYCNLYTLTSDQKRVEKGVEIQISSLYTDKIFSLLKNFIKNNKVSKHSNGQTI